MKHVCPIILALVLTCCAYLVVAHAFRGDLLSAGCAGLVGLLPLGLGILYAREQ